MLERSVEDHRIEKGDTQKRRYFERDRGYYMGVISQGSNVSQQVYGKLGKGQKIRFPTSDWPNPTVLQHSDNWSITVGKKGRGQFFDDSSNGPVLQGNLKN